MGAQAPPELLGIHTNMAERDSTRHRQGRVFRCAGAGRSLSRREGRLRATELRLCQGHRLRLPDGAAAADAVRHRGFPRRPGGVFPRSRRAQLRAHRARLQRTVRGPHARRHPRQRHDHLVDEHGGFRRPPLLGEQGGVVLRRQGRQRRRPGGRERLSRRALSGPAELGGAGVSQTDLLQRSTTKAGTSRPGNSRSSSSEDVRAGFRSLR